MSPTCVVDVSIAVGSELTIRICTLSSTSSTSLRSRGMWRATIPNEGAVAFAGLELAFCVPQRCGGVVMY